MIKDEIVIISEAEYLHIPITAEIRKSHLVGDEKTKPHVTVVE